MAVPKSAFSRSAVATAPTFVAHEESDTLQAAIRDRVSKRAYQLYEESGHRHGDDQRHWFQAEAEVLCRGFEVRDSGAWVIANGCLPEVPAEDVYIYIDSRQILVRTNRAETSADQNTNTDSGARTETFLVADLDVEVEAATASASLKDQKLTLMVKKRANTKVEPIRLLPN